jgi:hypothetical protein
MALVQNTPDFGFKPTSNLFYIRGFCHAASRRMEIVEAVEAL